ncbi:MAG: V-type ATP synthase subunit E, partial [Candidatus Hodarchaeales archaeon]
NQIKLNSKFHYTKFLVYVLSLGNIDKIVQEIVSTAEIEREKIEKIAKNKITELNDTASKDLDRIRNQILEKNRSTVEAENKRMLGKSRLESKMILLNEKENKIKMVFDEVVSKLKSFTQSGDYSSTLRNLAVSGGVALEGGDLTVLLRKEDVSKFNKDEAVQKIKELTNTEVTVTIRPEESKTKIGGLMIEKGNIFVDNTFESIIQRRNAKLRETVTEILFKD